MAIDPNIALSGKPVEIANPVNQFAQVAQLQHYQQQNALATRAMEQEDAVNRAYTNALNPQTGEIDPVKLRQNMVSGGAASKLPTIEKTLLEGRKLKAEVGKSELELGIANADDAIRKIAAYNSRADALLHIQNDVASGKISQQQGQQFASMLPPDDSGMPQFQLQMLRKALSAKDQLEQHFVSQDTGGSTRVVAMPKFGGGPAQVVQGSQVAKTMSPSDVIARDRENRLAQGPMATTLTPEQNDALFGENGAVASGKINPNRINSRNAKMWADAFLRNPNADPVKVAQDVGAADKAIRDFGTGEQGKKVTAFNTAIDHLDTLDKLGAALKSGDIKLFNSIANGLGIQTGGSAATMYNQAAKIVGGEVSKAIVPGVGTGKEREETAAAFSSAMSPEQLVGASATAKKLLGGQLSSLELQYQRTTKRKDFADQFLSPAARAAYQTTRAPAASTAPAVSAAPAGVDAALWNVMTPEERKLWQK